MDVDLAVCPSICGCGCVPWIYRIGSETERHGQNFKIVLSCNAWCVLNLSETAEQVCVARMGEDFIVVTMYSDADMGLNKKALEK